MTHFAKNQKCWWCLHFDQLYYDPNNDQDLIKKYWQRLIANTYHAVREKVNRNDPMGLLMIMGITIHILNDFYAHSNWTELDLPTYTNQEDATYFDVIKDYPDKLEVAVNNYKQLPIPKNTYGFYTNGNDYVPTPDHNSSCKDYAGTPYFDGSYRIAYRGTLEWIKLIEKWVCQDFNSPGFWSRLKTYDFIRPEGKTHLATLTSVDEGTIRWMMTAAKCWKQRWVINWYNFLTEFEVAVDNMPNVPGFGFTEQVDHFPYLGIDWFENCSLIAIGLIQAKDTNNVHLVQSVDHLAEALAGNKQDFHKTVQVTAVDISNTEIPYLDSDPVLGPVITDAITTLANSFKDNYNVKWLRLSIPKVRDLDGADWFDFNLNDEEWGGTSDYWGLWTINGIQYSESEYTDESEPCTNWGVIKPLWNNDPVEIKVEMFESDPTNHKDETMDISPDNSRFDLTFTMNPATGEMTGLPNGCDISYNIHDGYIVRSPGNDDDLQAEVNLKAKFLKPIPAQIEVTILEACTKDKVDSEIGGLFYHESVWADFYGKVTINGYQFPATGDISNEDHILPDWKFFTEVNKDGTDIPIRIELWDSDPGDDDHCDINPAGGKRYLDLVYHMSDNTITGDVSGNAGERLYSEGQGDSDRCMIWFVINPVTASGAPVGSSSSQLYLKYKNGDGGTGQDNQIKPHLILANRGNAPVSLKDVKIRYWYTSEGGQDQQFCVDFAGLGNANIIGKFSKIDKKRVGADSYLEIGFTGTAGNLPGNQDTGEIQVRFNKSDWSNYNEADDYSYGPSQVNYGYWNKITVYLNGVLVYGTEPPVDNTPPKIPNLLVKYRCLDPTPGNNEIKPNFIVVNNSSSDIPLSGLKIRYWYTRDGIQTQNYWVDYATKGSNNITCSFVTLNTARPGADAYLEVGFTSAAGIVFGGGNDSGEVQIRVSPVDWSQTYNETNDYSFDPSKTVYTEWNRITLYYNGVLIYGV